MKIFIKNDKIKLLRIVTLSLLVMFSYTLYAQQFYPVRNRLEVTNLDGTWQFLMNGDNEWRELKVPGNWETQGVKMPEYGRDLSELNGRYRRTFEWQEQWHGREVVLRLDGVLYGFKVFVNGHKVGSGHSGHTMHQFIITSFLNKGRNEISIEASTHSKYWLFDVCDAWSLTGIQRSVEIFSVPKEASLADVIFTSKVLKDNSADIFIKVKTNGGPTLSSTQHSQLTVTASLLDERYNHVCDLRGKVIGDSVVMSTHIERPRLWNAETPNLYRLNVKLYSDKNQCLQSIEEKVGIREIRVENCKILLNNREIFLRGVCLSENDAIEGSAMSLLNRRKQLEQMKAANINFIRTAHYPLDPAVMRLCDEIGFYVCEEIPFASRGDEYLRNDTNVIDELKARAKATIDRDRNCPCIIMWSHGNENKIFRSQDSVLLFTKLYDPSRLRGLPQAKGQFMSHMKRPSKYANVICGHYANDGVLAQACEISKLPIINTEFAHSLGTAFSDLEHKYEIFRREPKIAGGSIWCYQDQSILTHNFNQQNQVLKGVRIDSLRYIDNYGLNPVPENRHEKGKEGADGIVYGDGYPQEDYFELAQVYTPVYIDSEVNMKDGVCKVEVENRFDFINLHGYSLQWQLKSLQKVLDDNTVYLKTPARNKEVISIPVNKSAPDLILAMQIIRPDGSLCYERHITLRHATDYSQLISETKGTLPSLQKNWLKTGFKLRVGRPVGIGLDYRRKGLWQPYLLDPLNLKVKKHKKEYIMTCRWSNPENTQSYIEGDIRIIPEKDGTTHISYTLTPSDSIDGKFLDFGLAIKLPKDYTDVAWLGYGPFSHTPGKTAFNNRDIWKLHKNDIRFYGNRADVDLLAVRSDNETMIICTTNKNIHFENINGNIVLTNNLVVGNYGDKFNTPFGKDANKLGQRTGSIVVKSNTIELLKSVFNGLNTINPEQPYFDSYEK